MSINHKEKINLVLSDVPVMKSGRGYGYTYGSYGYGYGYSYGYGESKRSRSYGAIDYVRTRLGKRKEENAYKYIEDEE